ncbi:MAG: hypothetical protein DRP71_07790 [Verrucomicrobia bacterium]|nr:MAG: hypothetical protein DRP71_07790 [Verrucomicrobiota bacterium]
MSLINDALKKAQSVQGPPPGVTSDKFSGNPAGTPGAVSGPGSAGHVPRRSDPMSAQKLVMILLTAGIVFIGFIAAMGVGAYYVINSNNPETGVETEIIMVDAEGVILVEEPEPVVVVEPEPEPQPEPVVVPDLPPPPPAIRVNRPDPEILAFVDTLRVRGIRISNGEAKVLMNDKVYKTGEIVNHPLNLKLSEVSSDGLLFEDVQGNTYVARF